jgi:hypothetical protein
MADGHGSASELKVRQNRSYASCIQGGGSVEVDLVRQRGVAAETLTCGGRRPKSIGKVRV